MQTVLQEEREDEEHGRERREVGKPDRCAERVRLSLEQRQIDQRRHGGGRSGVPTRRIRPGSTTPAGTSSHMSGSSMFLTLDQRQQDGRYADAEQQRPDQVELVATLFAEAAGDQAEREHDRECADGDVDVEDPAPALLGAGRGDDAGRPAADRRRWRCRSSRRAGRTPGRVRRRGTVAGSARSPVV